VTQVITGMNNIISKTATFGEGTRLGEFCCVGDNVVIGDGCEIGNG